ncbi:TIGR03016 family PEP-CTERM system-associated outer membrane protein [Phenylobacterium sp. LjRoot219]|uniref:TIGR03016 family PEP-CTERM system-associated outer membrane protein n=1 Tax=Phenylobacterium sp. LjRoot219 TaxID=3342283 RepID=UPI003ECFC5D4
MHTRSAGARLQKPRLFCTALVGAAAWAYLAPSAALAQPIEPEPPGQPSASDRTLSPWVAEPPPPMPAAPPPPREARPEIIFEPEIGIEGTFTDNAELTSDDRKSDFIARVALGLTGDIDRGRTTGWLRAFGYYDQYFNNSSLSGWTLSSDAFINYDVVKDIFAIQAGASYSDQYVSVLGVPTTERAGAPGRARVGLYYVGPELTTQVRSFADLYAAGRIGQVFYTESDGSDVEDLPADDTFLQLGARLDTGARGRVLQSVSTAKFSATDSKYRSTSLVQSAYIRVAPMVRLIARGGYERVRQTGVVNIDAPMFSAGVELRPNADSRLSLEGGNRYDRPAWAASADWRISRTLLFTARYWEVLAPNQLQVVDAFADFVSTSDLLPAPTSTAGFRFGQNIANQISYNKQADMTLVFDRPSYRLDWSAGWFDQRFLDTDTRDKSVTTTFTATRHARADLDLIAQVYIADTYESDAFNEGTSWGAEATLAYRLNSTTDAQARYRYQQGQEFFVEGDTFHENAVMVSLQKRF